MQEEFDESGLTIDSIVAMLLKDGMNSKRLVFDRLSNLTREDILSLMRDLKVRLITEKYATKDKEI